MSSSEEPHVSTTCVPRSFSHRLILDLIHVMETIYMYADLYVSFRAYMML
jgi:hypothetical protein